MSPPTNVYTQRPISVVLLRTALPIVFLTSVNGLLTVIDAMLLGVFVGPDALAAATLVFPASMVLVALSAMVSTGMASVLARHLGGNRPIAAQVTFAGAHGLALLICVLLVVLYVVLGPPIIAAATADSHLAGMARTFLAISVLGSPLTFLVGMHTDALRAEGRVGFMAGAGLAVTLSNIVLNIVFVAGLQLGIAGSAASTVLAQGLALVAVLVYRAQGRAVLRTPRPTSAWRRDWLPILALGAPRSLGFLGIALGSLTTLTAVALYAPSEQSVIVAAYGAVTRMMTFAYLPVLGLSLALQAVAGNNAGAGLAARAKAALRLSVLVSAIYCAAVALVLLAGRDQLGALFVGAPDVDREVGRILPYYAAFYVSMGPVMMLASYAQSLGDARRAALLSLARTYLFAIPLTLALPLLIGPTGIWAAIPSADLLMIMITVAVLRREKDSLRRQSV